MKIVITDEVNCILDGFPQKAIDHLRDKIKYREKDCFMVASYKMGMWDGYTSLIDENGCTYFTVLDRIIDELDKSRLVDMNQIDVEDLREKSVFPEKISMVGNDYVLEETGYNFRDHQEASVNSALARRKGILELATNAGKTVICLAISKRLDEYTKSVIVVPYESLANQTYEQYAKSGLDVLLLNTKIKPPKRLQAIRDHRHIIVTTKLFQNCIEHFAEHHFALLVDEVHIMGDVMEETLRLHANHFQFRIGLTGTLPSEKKDPLKRNKIIGCIGGGVISKLAPSELIEQGFASVPTITMVTVRHKEINDIFSELSSDRRMDWSLEQQYLWTNHDRAAAIADYIKSLPKTNTLILTQAQFGKMLVGYIGGVMIDKDTEVSDRGDLFSEFGKTDEVMQVASFGTSATGISENNIYRLILIDIGKDEKLILQAIGRGLRLDGVHNKIEVVDISSDTIYSNKHSKERRKIYKDSLFNHSDGDTIDVM